MKQKKVSSNWYIATTHWLTSAFAIPLILGFIFLYIIGYIYINYKINMALLIVPFYPLVYWLGAKYSASYLNRTYIIKDSNDIAKKATIIAVIIGGIYRLLQIMGGKITIEQLAFVLSMIAFYFASKKYIKQDSISTLQPAQIVS